MILHCKGTSCGSCSAYRGRIVHGRVERKGRRCIARQDCTITVYYLVSAKRQMLIRLHGIVATTTSHYSVCTHRHQIVHNRFRAGLWSEYSTHLLFPQAFADKLKDRLEQHSKAILILIVQDVVGFSGRCYLSSTSYRADKG